MSHTSRRAKSSSPLLMMSRTTTFLCLFFFILFVMGPNLFASFLSDDHPSSSRRNVVGVAGLYLTRGDPKYDVVWSGHLADVPKSTIPEGLDKDRWLPMQLPNGSSYVCLMPGEERDGPSPFSEEEGGGEEGRKRASSKQKFAVGTELAPNHPIHQLLQGQCAVKPAGWWVYELCWGKWVRQYHPDPQKGDVDENFLGKANHPTVPTRWVLGESMLWGTYVSTIWGDGTNCDLTHKPRQIEVRVVCPAEGQADSAIEISEPETCRYLVWFQHRSVCSIPELGRAENYAEVIPCYETTGITFADEPPAGTAAENNKEGDQSDTLPDEM